MRKPKTKRRAITTGARGSPTAPPTNAWAPGQSGNPEGRPKTDPELVEAFRGRTMKALAVLDKVLDGYVAGPSIDEEGVIHAVKPADAVKASEVVLNRGWGTAPTTIKLDVQAEVKSETRVEVMTPLRLARVVQVLMKAGALPAVTGEVAPVSSDESKEEP